MIFNLLSPINFGKYKRKNPLSLKEIIDLEPGYVNWLECNFICLSKKAKKYLLDAIEIEMEESYPDWGDMEF